MGIGVSLILIAAGAILTWAVNATVSGVDINTIGVILMVVGAIGLILSLMFWSSWGGVGGTSRRRTRPDPAAGVRAELGRRTATRAPPRNLCRGRTAALTSSVPVETAPLGPFRFAGEGAGRRRDWAPGRRGSIAWSQPMWAVKSL